MFSTNIRRRQFIKLLSSSGILASIPFFTNESFSSSERLEETRYMKKALFESIRSQNQLNDFDTAPVQSDNLEYAFDKITPNNHLEYCFVTWCGAQRCSVTHYADEFIRRKEGKTSQFPDHPALEAVNMGTPDTHRILVFKEQIEALFKLWGIPSVDKVRRRFIASKISVDEFSNLLHSDPRNRLTYEGIKAVHGALEFYTRYTLPFCWCSTLVQRAKPS